ncbi:MAG: methyltransferase domain-containing protein [bacterium]
MFKNPEEKINHLYLQQIGTNEDEKFGDLKYLIIEDKLPKVDGKINILEIGVGGGETIKKLKEQLYDRTDINIIGLDSVVMFAQNFKTTVESEAVVADAGMLPIKENSLSGVNASAILHEVSSYGVRAEKDHKVFGEEAVRRSLNEIKRCLAENGMLIYRDVACPPNRFEVKTVDYDRRSWQLFLDIYLPILHKAGEEVCPEMFNEYTIGKKEDGISLKGTAQLQREIQRHYITFRDYFRKKVFPQMGVKVKQEDWVKKKEGAKRHILELTGEALEYYIAQVNPEQRIGGIKKLDLSMSSDKYDDFTDGLMENNLIEKDVDFHEEWLRREGSEIYTYFSSEEMKEVAEKDGEQGVLVADKMELLPRYYYQRYLDRIIKNPEFEGKQTINFIKRV